MRGVELEGAGETVIERDALAPEPVLPGQQIVPGHDQRQRQQVPWRPDRAAGGQGRGAERLDPFRQQRRRPGSPPAAVAIGDRQVDGVSLDAGSLRHHRQVGIDPDVDRRVPSQEGGQAGQQPASGQRRRRAQPHHLRPAGASAAPGRGLDRMGQGVQKQSWILPKNSAPSGDSRTPRPTRSNSGRPSRASRIRIWWLTADGVSASSSAAARKLASRAAASKATSARSGRLGPVHRRSLKRGRASVQNDESISRVQRVLCGCRRARPDE